MGKLWKNSKGQWFHSSVAGTYPVNNGDPQNDYDQEEWDNSTEESENETDKNNS